MKRLKKLMLLIPILMALLCSFSFAVYKNTTTIQDSYVDSFHPATNYGTETILLEDGDAAQYQYTYFGFNFSELTFPEYAISANFSVYIDELQNPAATEIIGFFWCNDSFDESTITWNNRNTQITSCSATPFFSQAMTAMSTGRKDIDITDELKASTGDFVIKIMATSAPDGLRRVKTRSKEHANTSSIAYVEYNTLYDNLASIYPVNETTYYGSYNNSIILRWYQPDSSWNCSINDTRWDYQTNTSNQIYFINNTEVTTKQNISIYANCSNSIGDKENITFWFYLDNILEVYIYDVESRTLIDYENITVYASNQDVDYYVNLTTDTGYIGIVSVLPGNYEIVASSDNYPGRRVYEDVLYGSKYIVNMYLLNSSKSDYSVLRVIDEDGFVVEDVTINVLREFLPGFEDYRVVNEHITNFEGETISNFNRDNTYYKFQFWYNDVLVEETEKTLIFQDTLTHQLSLTEDALLSIKYLLPATTFMSEPYNASGVMKVDYTYSGSNLKGAKLVVTKRLLNSNDIIETQNSSSLSAGTLTVSWIPDKVSHYIIEGFVDTNTPNSFFSTNMAEYKNNKNISILGLLGIFITLIIVGTVASLNTEHPAATVIMALVALVVCSAIGFISLPWAYIVLLASIAGIIAFSKAK